MKKVLITGGKGFLGSRFAAAHRGRFEIEAPGSQELNVLDGPEVEKFFHRFNPDYVIHAAALAKTDFCDANPLCCHETNVKGSELVAKACARWRAKMIFLSTEQVFNGNSR